MNVHVAVSYAISILVTQIERIAGTVHGIQQATGMYILQIHIKRSPNLIFSQPVMYYHYN